MALLNGRMAIVTWAGRGLGRAHALALADHHSVSDWKAAAAQDDQERRRQ